MKNDEIQMTFLQKVENFWYHYKWHTLLGIFALIIIIICTVQCAQNNESDAMIMYAGSYKVADEYRERPLESIMSRDYNGDGEKQIDVFQLVFNIVEVGGEYEYYDAVSQTEELQRLEIEFTSGTSVIYILHPFIYSQYKNIMCPLSEVLEEVPEYAVDEYGIPMSELVSYMTTTLNFYPENSILCIRRKRETSNLLSRPDDDEYYQNNVEFFRDIIEY